MLSLTNIGKYQAKDLGNSIDKALTGVDLTSGSEEDIKARIKYSINDVLIAYGISNQNDIDAIVDYIYQDKDLDKPTTTLEEEIAVGYLHDFLSHFATNTISITGNSDINTKLSINMFDKENNLDTTMYDYAVSGTKTTLFEAIENVNVNINGNGVSKDATAITFGEITNGEQLTAIQTYATQHLDSNILNFNFALMNDIDASKIEDYTAIGSGLTAYTGTFDGRDNRIIGLNVTGNNAGIFDTIGNGGVVTNLRVYSSNFTGTDNAGAIAGVNNGRIENIIALGNEVTINGNAGNAGGIVGTNTSGAFDSDGILTNGIDNVQSTGSVIANATTGAVVGGLVGTNSGGINNSFSDSAVTVATGTTSAHLGGAVGYNTETGDVRLVDSLGVTNGGASDNVGGIIGTNEGNMYSGYNESIVSGNDNVGGIIGTNSGTVNNIVNATAVTGEDTTGTATDVSEYVGGLIGANSGTVTNGRNNGTITGTNYVGGMVGSNANGSTLTNLVNDSSADITGENYVGGIAGSNAGTIKADNDNLINRGSITGNQYVGGVAGENTYTGIITNTINSVVLNATGQDAKYFGGVVGQNSGLIDGATNTSDIDITAVGGTLVGGIIGDNTATGKLKGEILNQGSVTGANEVGGIIGQNANNTVLQGTSDNRLIVTNEGDVTAKSGGAAGIIYSNTGDIIYADITNSGTVDGGTQNTSVTGGLFGTNSGTITNSTLTNSGTVTGDGTVGGLIGNNSGTVSESSLINTADAQVSGTTNVGGLIGINSGTITGGRAQGENNLGYYAYKIYNNGVITGTGTGSNIGGLIGSNEAKGSLTAGYNTGAINANGSNYVGGIVGSNAGKVDQVFNTVFNSDGTNGAVTGGTNVGGIVGSNSGQLSNAYNTTEVNGTAGSTGNIAGNNTDTVENVYGNSALIGSNSGTLNNGYKVDNSTEWNKAGSYVGFAFSNGEYNNQTGIWKIYEGYGHPLLKVFLTSATYDPTAATSFVYNGQGQGLDINNVIAADNLAAYTKVNQLLQALQNKNAGNDYLGFVSEQIAASTDVTFNPNNLGYDIDVDYDIAKANLTVSLSTVNRTYGNSALTNGTAYSAIFNGLQGNDTYDADDYTLTNIVDGAVAGTSGNKQTNNAGTYDWSATVTLTDTDLANNYNIKYLDNTSGTISGTGNSIVDKADLTVSLSTVNRTYGNSALTNGTAYSASFAGLVNNDTYDANDYTLTDIVDGAVAGTSGNKQTNNAGTYNWGATVTLTDTDLANNYNIKGLNNISGTVSGTDNSIVDKADLTVSLSTVNRTYGNSALTNGTAYSASFAGLVNNDTYDANDYTLTDIVDGAVAGTSGNKQTNNAGTYNWGATVTLTDTDLANNYNIKGLNNISGTVSGTDNSIVDKAKLDIHSDDKSIEISQIPNYTGTDINSILVNGDKLADGSYNYGIEDALAVNTAGTYPIGIYLNGTYYELGDNWENSVSFFKNYDITFTPGTLTVSGIYVPVNPPDRNPWDYLYKDYPFGRIKNFRERKAEINFVDGGMEI